MGKLMLGTRAFASFLRALEFCIAALVLGIFSYYLAVIARRAGNPAIPKWEKAVEGMSGAAVIYTAFAVILTCFLGGITFFSFLGVVLDICFCGAFVAIAILAKAGKNSCGRANNSPIGPGEHLSCQLQRVTFIVAIIAAFLFLVSAALEILLARAHKREKRYGPGPSNDYTSGYGKQRFWQRKNRKNKNKGMQDAELGAVGAGALVAEDKHHHDHTRNSNITGDTAVTDGYGGANNKYATAQEPTLPPHQAAYNQPVTTGYATTTDYEPQSTGVSEMEGQTGSANRPFVQHDPEPYAQVHHGGYVHSSPESQGYVR